MSFLLTVIAFCAFIFSCLTFIGWLSKTETMLVDLKLSLASVIVAIVFEFVAHAIDNE